MTSYIDELQIQPRTGSMCPSSGPCQDSAQFSWKNSNNNAGSVTLGNAGTVSIKNDPASACRTKLGYSDSSANTWVWGNLEGASDNAFCIRPVEQLCYNDGPWNGMEYDPSKWQTTPLRDTFNSVVFSKSCQNTTTDGDEDLTMAQMCPITCRYDTRNFTSLDHVLAYEEKYGKYVDDTAGCAKASDVKSCLSKTSGSATKYTSNASPYSPNYEKLMVNFCSNKHTSSCHNDPLTGDPSPKCSYYTSNSEEGTKCRAWVNSYGPYKTQITQQIGDKYCKENPDSNDCACYSRRDPKNPRSATFMQVYNTLTAFSPAAANINPGCYYIPCADPANYIIGTDIFTPPSNSTKYSDPNYGFYCEDTVCANVINSGGNVYIDNNDNYIQCVSGGNQDDHHNNNDHGGGGGDFVVFPDFPEFAKQHRMILQAVGIGFVVIIIAIAVVIFVYPWLKNRQQQQLSLLSPSSPLDVSL